MRQTRDETIYFGLIVSVKWSTRKGKRQNKSLLNSVRGMRAVDYTKAVLESRNRFSHTAKSFSSISVDLTKKRLSLLHKAREVIEEKYGKESEVFAYADINCRLTVRSDGNNFAFFNSIDELSDILKD